MLSRIEEIMKKNGLNAKQFAEILGVGNSKITDWRNGKTKPTLNDIIGISQKFNMTTDYLIFGKENSKSLTRNEEKLIDNFRSLDSFIQGRVFEYIEKLRFEHHEPVQTFDVRMAAKGGGMSSQQIETTPSELQKWIEEQKKFSK